MRSSSEGRLGFRRAERAGLFTENGVEKGGGSVSAKRHGARGHLIEHGAEREQVAATVQFLAEGLLRRHVRHGSQCRARAGEVPIADGLALARLGAGQSRRFLPGRNRVSWHVRDWSRRCWQA